MLRRLVGRDPLFAALVGLLSALSLLPIWIGRYLPLLDYPNHLAMVFIWRRLHDPAWGFEPFYATRFVPSPNWAPYVIEYALGALFSDEAAQKLLLSLAVLGLPAAFAWLAHRWGRDPRLCVFAFPLAWNVNLAHGFLSYVAGLPVLFAALAALDRNTTRPSWRSGAVAALLGVACYGFHLLTWGLFLAIGAPSAIARPRPWSLRRALVSAAPTVPALGVALVAFAWGRTLTTHWRLGGAVGGIYNDLFGNLTMIPSWLIDLFPGHADEWAAGALALALVGLLAFRRRPPAPNPTLSPAWQVEMAFALTLLLYLSLPRSLTSPFYWYAVNRRLAVVVMLFLVLLVPGKLETRAGKAWLALATAAGAFYLGVLALEVHRFNVRMRDFDRVMQSVPPRKQVQLLMFKNRDPAFNVAVFNQWSSWVQLRQGGYQPFNLDQGFPIVATKQLPAPPWDEPNRFTLAEHGTGWDYFLVYGRDGDPFAVQPGGVRLLRRVGEWALFGRP